MEDGQVGRVHRVARGAGGDDADGVGIFFARDLGEFPDGLGGVRDGFRLEPVRFVKALAEPRLAALLVDGLHVAPAHVRHQQLDRVGADINDRAAHSFHCAPKIGNVAREAKIKNVTFCRLCARRRGRYHGRMKLFLLRHGLAVERGTRGFEDDAARPLTPKGRRQTRKTVAAMKKLERDFDLVLSSPLLRAKQTAEIVAGGLKLKKQFKFSNALAPGGEPKNLLRQLGRLKPPPEKLLLVGHEPDLSRLVSLLVTGGKQLQLDFKKGGLCQLDVEKLRAGKCATLAWLLTPKQMKLF